MMRRLLILLGVVAVSAASGAWAQDYDDIYYDSSKAKKEATQASKQKPAKNEDYYYSSNIINDRDVDEYNRRGNYAVYQDTLAYDTLQNGNDFQYTDRIKRFYNPSVIVETGDADAATLYVYTRPSVNIVVGTPSYYSPWGAFSWSYYDDFGYYDPWWGWRSPWYYSSYYYNPWRYSYWHDPFWCWHTPYYHHPFYGGWYAPVPSPGRYYGGNTVGARRPVGVGRGNTGAYYGNNRNHGTGNRIGNIVGGNHGTASNGVSGGSYRGGNVRFGSSGNANNGGVYRRPENTNRNNSSTYERSNSYNSSRSSFNNSNSNSGFSRGGGFSSGGGRMGGSSNNGARGGGHRR